MPAHGTARAYTARLAAGSRPQSLQPGRAHGEAWRRAFRGPGARRADRPNELYESVDWNVIFLLAGIPLGIALEQTGAAELIGEAVAATADVLPVLGVLWVFYLATALLTNVISNNASVVLMIPVAIETAGRVGANAFAFVLAVSFAASTAFMTPVGYQTNLFVYGAGGYRFADHFRVGAPLQLLSVVTTLAIAYFWPL